MILASVRNPALNSSINPSFNSSINPNYNSSINPNYNGAINPNFNSSINPNFNSAINPNFNSSINPNFNSSINPNFNSAINPIYNTSINPNYSANINGYYLHSWDVASVVGFAVRASNQVLLVYNTEVKCCSFGVVANNGIIVQFDFNMQWIGFWVPNGIGNYCVYNTSIALTGYTT